MADYTLTELMAVAAAREIADEEVVFAGTGLPMLGAMLAQRTHAPRCCIIFEAGTVASQLAHLPMSVGDPRAMRGAAMAAGLFEVFSFVLQAGRVDVGFLSGAQVDRFGNINSTAIGADPRHPQVRFSGSGGACDIACLAKRTVIIALHERRRFPEKVDYITSPGWLTGGNRLADLRESEEDFFKHTVCDPKKRLQRLTLLLPLCLVEDQFRDNGDQGFRCQARVGFPRLIRVRPWKVKKATVLPAKVVPCNPPV